MILHIIKRYRETQRPDLLDQILATLREPCSIKDLCEIFALFSEQDIYQEQLFFALFLHLRQFSLHYPPPQLAELCGLDTPFASQIFSSPPSILRKITFPIANEQQADLCTAYIIPLQDDGPSVLWGPVSTHTTLQKRHQDLQRIQTATQKRFFVAFDKDFTDRSFMLALAAALLLDRPDQWDPFAFSGEIDHAGHILDVGYMEAKQAVCKKHHKKLLSAQIFQHLDEIRFWLSGSPLPLPSLFLAKSLSHGQNALQTIEKTIQRRYPFFRIDTLCALFGFQRQDFLLCHEDRLPDDPEYWKRYLQNGVRLHFERLLYTAPDHSFVLHAASSIIALTVGIGSLLGAKRPIVLYHFQNNDYYPVIDLSQNNIRELKAILPETSDESRLLCIQPQADGPKHIVGIYLASHDPFGACNTMLQQYGDGWGFTFLSPPQHQGNLPLSADWLPYVREIYSFLNRLSRSSVSEMHLVLSVPIPISYALGMACGHFFHAYVYNFNPTTKEYTRVLALHEHPSPF